MTHSRYSYLRLTWLTSNCGHYYGQTPLESTSVDVAVFCLSLMGTNYPNYLLEAKRVLKPRLTMQFCSLFRVHVFFFQMYFNNRLATHAMVQWLASNS